ncbi:MAG TPA: flagellin domain-containing protein [Nitrosomonas europaea]|uniref:Flagellin n=1 Tax=Nitrosomonas europaea (strain ATCC 19718 / CIP 103999 / KCTC 2705 / NBRC 14298) TaxID=228410 RepID=Q82UA3_NITEU|nr:MULTISPECIES: flagellin domain-containing protein [Nitrosomonas]CAD85504.1 hag; flagellin [Nitrosomonas europaea ATCC 19718]SDW46249.1 flagellin [Nitrosomonas europaea]SET08004.1 flagellin [Nitrosomonas europaea]SJZ59228.1 flagellin [Nitrosomonas europaea]HBF25455.1 flagellin FliC [Nitrosomonas sp.]
MPQVINTNIASLNAQRNLNVSQNSLSTALQRLSSGLRINSAKDDAAGLAISERMTSQIRGMNQAARNANDGISLAQTAEGALVEIGNNLQRIRELAVQSANATNSEDDREALQKEVTQLIDEIQRVGEQTSFNGTKLLDGSFASQIFQVGANEGETIDFTDIADVTASGLSVDSVDITGTDGTAAASVITTIDDALKIVNSTRADLGAIQNRFSSAIANLQTSAENLSASRSRIQDADFAAETAALTRAQILQQAGVAMLSQANALPNNVLSLLR